VKHSIDDHIVHIRKQKDRDRERTRERERQRRKVTASSRSIWKNNQAKKHMYEEKMKEREGDGKGEKRHRSSEAATIVAREKGRHNYAKGSLKRAKNPILRCKNTTLIGEAHATPTESKEGK
jgi:hypothetical protein